MPNIPSFLCLLSDSLRHLLRWDLYGGLSPSPKSFSSLPLPEYASCILWALTECGNTKCSMVWSKLKLADRPEKSAQSQLEKLLTHRLLIWSWGLDTIWAHWEFGTKVSLALTVVWAATHFLLLGCLCVQFFRQKCWGTMLSSAQEHALTKTRQVFLPHVAQMSWILRCLLC